MSFVISNGGVWVFDGKNDVGNFRTLRNKTIRTRCAVQIQLAAVADAPGVLFGLGRNHRLFPLYWEVIEEDGSIRMLLDIAEPAQVIGERFPNARIITSCTEVLR
jgi:hypothetical protein